MASIIKDKLSKVTNNSAEDDAADNGDNDHNPANKYLLKVTAGPSYEECNQHQAIINGDDCVVGDKCRLTVRINEYEGIPRDSPAHSAYFNDPAHKKDTYSIAFSWIPDEDVTADDLTWGIELINPIRDRIPKRFITTAFNIVKSWIDPSLDCDPYADQPWVSGAILCGSAMIFNIGGKHAEAPHTTDVLVEGAEGDGETVRHEAGIPDSEGKRRKHFSSEAKRKAFVFEKGRCYQFDFHNGYIDWKNYTLKLPGFSLGVLKWINDRTHTLRFVLKNRGTGEPYLVVTFSLLFGEELNGAMASGGSCSQVNQAHEESSSDGRGEDEIRSDNTKEKESIAKSEDVANGNVSDQESIVEADGNVKGEDVSGDSQSAHEYLPQGDSAKPKQLSGSETMRSERSDDSARDARESQVDEPVQRSVSPLPEEPSSPPTEQATISIEDYLESCDKSSSKSEMVESEQPAQPSSAAEQVSTMVVSQWTKTSEEGGQSDNQMPAQGKANARSIEQSLMETATSDVRKK